MFEEIYRKRHDRFRQLIDELEADGESRREIGKTIGIHENHLCSIYREAKNLTENVALTLLYEYFTDTRIQWLLGFDDYRTEEDLKEAVMKEMSDEIH